MGLEWNGKQDEERKVKNEKNGGGWEGGKPEKERKKERPNRGKEGRKTKPKEKSILNARSMTYVSKPLRRHLTKQILAHVQRFIPSF